MMTPSAGQYENNASKINKKINIAHVPGNLPWLNTCACHFSTKTLLKASTEKKVNVRINMKNFILKNETREEARQWV